MADGKGYLFPDNPDIQELVCIRVFIPKHKLYIGAFWGAYEFFTHWVAWMRDPLKRGRDAARAWLRAYDKARAEYLITNGECFDMITGIQTNPLDPCVLQMQIDGGAWMDFFDARCCGGGGGGSCAPAMRVNGGQVEQWNNDAGAWVPAGPVTPPNEQQVPIGNGISTNDGACIAATNAAHEINRGLTKFATVRGLGANFMEAVLDAFDFLVALWGVTWVLAFFGDILSNIWNGFNVQSEAILALDIIPDLICMILPHYKDDRTMTQPQVNGLIAELNSKAAEFTTETPEWLAWTYVSMWVKAAGSQGMTTAAASSLDEIGECESCPWEVTFDFTVSPCGFVRTPVTDGADYSAIGPYFGKYIPGSGWKSESRDIGGGNMQQRLAASLSFESCQLDRVAVTYSSDRGDNPELAGAFVVSVQKGGYSGGGLVVNSDFGNGTNSIMDSTFASTSVEEVTLQAYINRSGSDVPNAFVVIHKMTLYGTGTKPGIVPIP